MSRIVTAAALESFEPEHRLRFAALTGDDLARSRCSGIWEDRTCTRRGKIPEVFQLNDRPLRGGVAIQRDHPWSYHAASLPWKRTALAAAISRRLLKKEVDSCSPLYRRPARGKPIVHAP
jgi:hypothetical protein